MKRRKEWIKLSCSVCSVTFERVPWEVRRKKAKKHFCSRKCVLVYMSTNPLHTTPHREQSRKKMSESHRATIISEQRRQKMRLIGKQSKTQFKKGHKFSEETISKIREARVKQVFPKKETYIERLISEALQQKGILFEKQKPLEGICVVDIYIKPNIALFCDGDYWHNLPNYKIRDARINRELIKKGYKVYRFWEHQIKSDVNSCINSMYGSPS